MESYGTLWSDGSAVVLLRTGAMRVLFSHCTGIAWVQIVEGRTSAGEFAVKWISGNLGLKIHVKVSTL